MENKIDSYITRYNEIADELDNIRTNLNLIQKEFKQEYDDDIIVNNDNEKRKETQAFLESNYLSNYQWIIISNVSCVCST